VPPRRVVGTGFIGTALVAVLTGCTSGGRPAASPPALTTTATAAPTTTTTAPPPATTSTITSTTSTTIDAGRLPQTDALPSATTPQFEAEMADLWQGVTTGAVNPGLPAFFPEGAYQQLKAIGNATSDWQYRLVGEYQQDIQAAHGLLDGAPAKLLSVSVPTRYAHWVPPNVCYNRVGYYEVPNSRVVYEVNGQTRSFGIASMISWRGVWYVVHLGAVLRSSNQGVVDDPAEGTGFSQPSSTC
jgi:hypothetical protein